MAFKLRGSGDYSSWMSAVPAKDTRPNRHEIVDRIKTGLRYKHYETGHFYFELQWEPDEEGFATQVRSLAACPECQHLAVQLTFRRKPINVERLFKR